MANDAKHLTLEARARLVAGELTSLFERGHHLLVRDQLRRIGAYSGPVLVIMATDSAKLFNRDLLREMIHDVKVSPPPSECLQIFDQLATDGLTQAN